MKKRILAVALAVLMIASSCILFATALTANAGTYVRKISASGGLLVDNLQTIAKGTDFDAVVEVTPKTSISLNTGTTEVTADNVDDLFTFKRGSSTLTYSGNLSSYFEVEGTIVGDNATAVFKDKAANTLTIYYVDPAITSSDVGDVSDKLTAEAHSRYILDGSGTYNATVSKWVTKLSSVTMGVRFYGKTYNNLVASEIAIVKAEVRRQSGAVSKQTSSVSNVISDLLTGDEVSLETFLKDPADKEYYAFNCWVDGSGEVVSTEPRINFTVSGNVAYYACYVELKNRFTISYSIEGQGDMVVLSDKNDSPETRGVFDGSGQISVMEGKDFTFTFVPKEGYEISKVIIDGSTNVASFKSLLTASNILDQIKVLINATGADRALGGSQVQGAYTFKSVDKDHKIKVVFTKSEPLEAPSGLDMPLAAPEGVELQTGAADADGSATTVPAEDGAAAGGGSAVSGIVNPATGSGSAVIVSAAMTVAAGAAFVTLKKKKD